MNPGTDTDNRWIRRCFELARRGIGYVSPNPPVGAVIMHNDRVLSEGYHEQFGGPHAEVMAFDNVPAEKRHLIAEATLYVSLEPCCITGKTPPCTDRIIREGIRDVRISAIDPNPAIAGKGIEILNANGVRTTTGVLENEGKELIKSFTTNIINKRPHVVLKWAQSKFGFTGMHGLAVWLSDPQSRIFTHRLRHESDAILVGARTIETDDPLLTTRDYPGRSPHRVVYDPETRLHSQYRVFNEDDCHVYYFSKQPNPFLTGTNITLLQLNDDTSHASQLLAALFTQKIGKVLVEGGSFTQHLFISENVWDEAWVMQTQHELAEGIKAPVVRGKLLIKLQSGTDRVIRIERTEVAY